MKIMFICTGNICRSAMAHHLFEKMLIDNKVNNIEIYSSGIYAENGWHSTYEAIEVMKEYDVDLKKHRATNTSHSEIKDMDLILGMTDRHKEELIYMYPELKDKIYTLKEYVGETKDGISIKDPWGFDIATYRFCAAEINKCLELLIKKI